MHPATRPRHPMLALLCVVCLSACVTANGASEPGSSTAAAAGKGVAPQLEVLGGKVFHSEDGIRVEMAVLKPNGEKKRVLLRVKNLAKDWDNKVLYHDVKEANGQSDFTMTYKGKPWVTMAERNIGDASLIHTVNLELPGMRESITIWTDDEASATFHPQDLLKAYQKQGGKT